MTLKAAACQQLGKGRTCLSDFYYTMASPLSPVVATTSLPKKTLSYKWNIEDARLFLKELDELKSPPFSLSLPACMHSRLGGI